MYSFSHRNTGRRSIRAKPFGKEGEKVTSLRNFLPSFPWCTANPSNPTHKPQRRQEKRLGTSLCIYMVSSNDHKLKTQNFFTVAKKADFSCVSPSSVLERFVNCSAEGGWRAKTQNVSSRISLRANLPSQLSWWIQILMFQFPHHSFF